MNQAAPDGGGGGDFRSELVAELSVACKYFRELAVNEEAVEQLTQLDQRRIECSENGTTYYPWPASVSFPGSHGFWSHTIMKTDLGAGIQINDLMWGGDYGNQFNVKAQQLVDAADSYAMSLHGGTCEYLCNVILDTDTANLSSAAQKLAGAASGLIKMTDPYTSDADSLPGFVTELRTSGWTPGSLGSDSFYDFYGTLAITAEDYAESTQILAVTSIAVAAVIQQYRNNMIAIVKGARKSAEKALQHWQDSAGPVYVSQWASLIREDDMKVLDGISTALDILGFIPVVGDATGTLANVVTAGQFLGNLKVPAEWKVVAESRDLHENLHVAMIACEEELLKALDTVLNSDQQSVVDADGKAADADGDGKPDTITKPRSFAEEVQHAEGNPSWKLPSVEFS